jgi:uncharacterized protein (TIGR03118 family)
MEHNAHFPCRLIAHQSWLPTPARRFLPVLTIGLMLCAQGRSENKYLQHNLVSDIQGVADFVDPDLTNPWGLAASPTSPLWISNNHSGTAKIYDSSGKPGPLVVNLRAPGGAAPSTPTGQVFNSTKSFVLPGGKPALFLFATEDGTISGWYSGIEKNEAVVVVDHSASARYKGLETAASEHRGSFLLAADFRNAIVEVFDAQFAPLTLEGAFKGPDLPAGYAPFNVYADANRIYVAYAKQDDSREDDQPGDSNGYVSVFDTEGRFVQRLISGGKLNSPWGMVMAPAGFGDFGGSLLVGNFGDGTINAYDPQTGAFRGALQDANGNPIVNSGLWGLKFGNGKAGGDANALYFTAGISGPNGDAIETHGLLGSIQAAPAIRDQGVVNAAGFQAVIAPGAWTSIFGRNLSPVTRVWKDSDFIENRLPVDLGGVSVTIDGKPAYVSYVSPTQLNVIAPAGIATGDVEVRVKSVGLLSAAAKVPVQSVSPAFFEGAQYALAFHGAEQAAVEPAHPAEAGETITLYGTGFGATNPPVPDGENIRSPLPLAAPLQLSLAGLTVEVAFAGVVAPGLYQINAKVPAGVTTGDVALIAVANGISSPGGVLLSTRGAPPPTAGSFSAEIDNFRFSPSPIEVTAGSELTWTNKQGVQHTVVSDNGKFFSGILDSNQTFSTKFETSGTYDYHCSIHPFMKGKVIVK